MEDADLNGEDAPEPRGKPGRYVHYLKARAELAERLGATAQEMAMWTWLGQILDGKPAGGLDGYRDPDLHAGRPPHFHFEEDTAGTFDYLAQLMGCYYRVEDLQAFEPEDRYLTFDRVVHRFTRFCAATEAAALAREKVKAGDLDSYHPQTGGTAGTRAWGEEPGFPPLEQGLFSLAQVRGVEVECGGSGVRNAKADSRGGFVSLSNLLDGCWDLPFGELDRDQRETTREVFAPLSWDQISEEQRRALAAQRDYQRDPALEEQRARDWDESAVDWTYWRTLPTLSATEFIVLRHVRDPRKLDDDKEVFPGGKRPSLGQRVADDLRLIAADPNVSNKERLPLEKWMQWAKHFGLECPGFMHAHISLAKTAGDPKAGITPKEFIEKHGRYVTGGKRFLDKWFKGTTREKGERPEAARFRIEGTRGRYDEAAMVAALKDAGHYSELR